MDDVSIEGVAYAPRGSARLAGRLVAQTARGPDGAGDQVVDMLDADGTVISAARLAQITIDPRLGTAPRKLHFPDGALFETTDHDAIARLTGRRGGDWLHGAEAFRPRLVAVVAGVVLAAFLLWRYGLDLLVTAAIALTPPFIIDQIDAGTVQTVDLVMRAQPTELPEEEQTRIASLFTTLLTELPEGEAEAHDFTLEFRAMPRIGPNAFALPGGTVIITDEFAKRFPQEDVLAGVLGHEIGHVVAQHGLRQMYRSLSIYFLVGFLAGDTGPFLDELLLEGNLLLSLSFSRAAEQEADAFGVTLSNAAGYDPTGLAVFFQRMGGAGGGAEWLSTHPSSENRVEQIEGYIDALE